jgi:hypothetical protein
MRPMQGAWRVVALVGVVAAAVVLFVVLRPDDEGGGTDTTPTTTAPTTAPTTTAATTTAPATTAPVTTAPPPPTTIAPPVRTFRLSVPAGGPQRIERLVVKEGQLVRIVVTLAEAGEVHLHGYDIARTTGPGRPPARLEFRATTPGRFEIELEETAEQIAELRVNP